MKQWKRLAALSSAIVMAAATLTYFPSDTLQNIRWEISVSADETGAEETSADESSADESSAATWTKTESDGLTWTLDADGTLTISGTGAMKDYDYDSNPSPAYNNLNVKKIVIEDGVTSIGDYAFRSCNNLTSIMISNSVTSIGEYAFCNCRSLTSITIPDGVTSIGEYAFLDCKSLTSITIPDSVTSIGSHAFYDCSSLTSITIPNSVTSIGEGAFHYCSSLTSITIPDSVTNIEDYAFYKCSSLTSITIPDSVTSIGKSAFDGCSSLTSITIPKSVTSIESGVFHNCNNLTVYLENGSTLTSNVLGVDESKIVSYSQWNEDNLTWMLGEDGKLTISGTGAMKDYDYDDNSDNRSPVFWNTDVTSIVIEDGVTSIGKCAFWKCSNLTSITIPDSVTSIGESAFERCIGLSSVTIPDSVTSIGNYAFYACKSLTNITIPDSVTSIGNFAFVGCKNLTSITIPDSVTSIGDSAFSNCESLTAISLSCKSSLKKSDFGKQADLVSYTNQHILTKTEAKTATCTEDGNKEYWTCEHCGKYFLSDDANPETAKAVELSETVISALKHKNATTRGTSEPTETEPGYSGDRYCPDCDTVLEKGYTYWNEGNLTWKLDAKGTLTISGTGAMKDYDSDSNPSPVSNNWDVEKIVIEDGVTSIGDSAFERCSSLTSITIPNSVTSIGIRAFNVCRNLTNITIPDNVTSIGDSAFYNCRDLTSITIPSSVTSIGNFVFEGCTGLTSITIPDSITSIGDFAFRYCISLTSITIPDRVTSIGNAAFDDCKGLTSITIPDSVTSIGNSAFRGCSRLTSITIPKNVTSIRNSVFDSCKGLTSITIPDSVTSIGNKAFYNCSGLTSITIPSNVTSIGSYAFYKCTGLTSITIPDSVTSIGERAFVGCEGLTSITIPDSVTSIGNSVFEKCTNLQTISLSCKSSLKRSDFGEQADLVSYTNQHILTKTEAKTATCTEDGNKAYWTCEHCGKYFLSDDSNPETAKAVEQSETIIPASHKLTKVEAKDATCAKDGNKEYWTCEHCKKYFLSDDTNPETAKAVEQAETVIPALKHKNETLRGASKPDGTKPGYSGDRYCPDCDTVLEKGYTYWNEGNLTWKLDADGTMTISGTGAMKNYNYNNNPSPAYKNSNVKKVVIEDGVTSIGTAAFSGCGLISITIPNSVTSIGSYAFSYCRSLTSITIPDSVTSIEDGTFSYCRSLTSITIPDSVTSIGSFAFNHCNSLQTISLGCGSALKRSDFGKQGDLVSYASHILKKTAAKAATCTENGNKEYWTCEHCKKYFLSDDANPETAKAVEQSETVIPASHKLTKVKEEKAATCSKSGNKEYWTCEHCGKYFLSDDTNPATAKAVEQSETVIPALKHKNATTRGTSEPTETEPGYSGDRYCPDCDTVLEKGYTYWNEDNLTWKLDADGTLTISGTGAMKDYNADYNLSPAYNNSKVKKVVIEDGVTSIGERAFSNCSTLISITIPKSVTSIGKTAFYKCTSLTNITIPNSVTSIGNLAFTFCSSLTSITIPGSVTSIGSSAFSECSNLKSIIIPNSVTSIEYAAFYNCSSLTDIVIPSSVTSIGNRAFEDCRSLTSITIPDSVTSIGDGAFYNCSSLTNIKIPDSVTSIGESAFENCSNLTSITIPDSVTSIGEYAFSDCSNLKSIIIPNSVTSIGYGAFNSCSSLTSITIPDSVTSIENGAFYNCSSLTSIMIPDSVTSIGDSAFSDCTNLKTISLSCKSSLKKSDFGDQADLVFALHTLKKTEAKAATYTENGNKAYWTCEHCGKYFLSDDSNSETATAVELSETVIPALVQVATTTTPIKCVYGQDMNKIDLRNYVKNTDVVGEVTVKVATGSTLPDGMKLDGSNLSGKPAKAYEDGKEVTFTFTAENGNTANLTLLFLVAKADPTVEVAVNGDSHTEGDLVSELKLILSENSTKGVVELVSEIKALVAGKNTFTWKFTPEDENNYNMVTGTVVVNAQTTTTTTTTVTTTTTKATTTTKPSTTTTTKATVTTKPGTTTTSKATTTTKPSKTTTTNATTTNTATPFYGDVNLDGKVDILDAVYLNKYLATLVQFSDAQIANADCYQDGVLNDQDTTALVHFIILLIDDLPVQPTEK